MSKITDIYSRRKSSSGIAGRHWVGGHARMGGWVMDDPPYQPYTLVWMNEDGMIVGGDVVHPDQLDGALADLLLRSMSQPMVGPPGEPDAVRVSDAEQAGVLKQRFPGILVECAPTPELVELFDGMNAFMEDQMQERSYLEEAGSESVLDGFFKATAGLYSIEPWSIIDSDVLPIGVTIEELGVRDHIISVIGQLEESRGILLNESLTQFQKMMEVFAIAMDEGLEQVDIPHHRALNFELGADISKQMRREVAEHRWTIAAADAYPVLLSIKGQMGLLPLVSHDYQVFEALSLALCELCGEREALEQALQGGSPLIREYPLEIGGEKVHVQLSVPCAAILEMSLLPLPNLKRLQALRKVLKWPVDDERQRALDQIHDQLMGDFFASPEACDLQLTSFVREAMDMAAYDIGMAIHDLKGPQLRMLLYEIVPRRLDIRADELPQVIDEFTRFFRYLERAHGVSRAEGRIHALGKSIESRMRGSIQAYRGYMR